MAPSLGIAISAESGHVFDPTGRLDLETGMEALEIARKAGLDARLVDLSTLSHASFHGCDAVLLCLHGVAGGRGDVQGVLQRCGIPFNGPSASGMATAFDKVRARQLLAFHNLPVPAAVALGPHTPDERAVALLGWPCIVKPRRGALGVGVSRLEHVDEVTAAIDGAMLVDTKLVLERAISGVELEVVLHDDRVVGVAEVLRGDDGSVLEIVIPPNLSRSRLDGIHRLATRAVTALGLDRGWTRVDVMLHSRDNEVILEVEPLPPLGRSSVVARVAAAYGQHPESPLADTLLDLVRRVERRADVTAAMH